MERQRETETLRGRQRRRERDRMGEGEVVREWETFIHGGDRDRDTRQKCLVPFNKIKQQYGLRRRKGELKLRQQCIV